MSSEHVPMVKKIMYGAGDLTNSVLMTIIGVYFAIFLTDVVRLDPALAAAAIFVGRSADWINDPIIGHLSDRTRTRWGRRRPYLLFGAAPLAVAFFFFFWVPPFTSQTALAVYYGAVYLVFDLIATFVYMPYFALMPEITLDYDERTSMSTVRMVFSIIGSIIVFTTPTLVVKAFDNPRTGYFVMAIVFGTLGVLPMLVTFLGTRERPEFQALPQPTLRESLASVQNNRPFKFGLVIFLMTWTVIDLLSATLLYFITYWLRMSSTSELLMGSVFVSAVFFLPLWNWLAGRWDKRKAYIVGMVFFAAVLGVLIFLQPTTPTGVIFTVTILAGIGVAAAHVIPWAILPDAIELDEYNTGRRHEGAFYSLVTLAQKIASSAAVPLALLALKASGYVPNAVDQPESALWAIRGLIGIAPTLLLTGGIIFALRYPLTRERHAELRQVIAARRAEALADR